jgi:hypothetical protein
MKTIHISISDQEFDQFGLESTNLSFDELLNIVSKELSKQRLNRSIELAEKHGLSSMTMDEISKEVQALRKNDQSNY